MISKVLKGKRGDATLVFMITMMFLSAMLAAVAFAVILFSLETNQINNACQLAIEKTAYVLTSQEGEALGDEKVIGDNLIVEEKLKEELTNLLSERNMSLDSINISFSGEDVTMTGTVSVQTKNPFGASSVKAINFKYKGRFSKNHGV